MPDTNAKGQLESAELSISVTRADGTVEHFGKVAEWHRRPHVPIVRALQKRLARWASPRAEAPPVELTHERYEPTSDPEEGT